MSSKFSLNKGSTGGGTGGATGFSFGNKKSSDGTSGSQVGGGTAGFSFGSKKSSDGGSGSQVGGASGGTSGFSFGNKKSSDGAIASQDGGDLTVAGKSKTSFSLGNGEKKENKFSLSSKSSGDKPAFGSSSVGDANNKPVLGSFGTKTSGNKPTFAGFTKSVPKTDDESNLPPPPKENSTSLSIKKPDDGNLGLSVTPKPPNPPSDSKMSLSFGAKSDAKGDTANKTDEDKSITATSSAAKSTGFGFGKSQTLSTSVVPTSSEGSDNKPSNSTEVANTTSSNAVTTASSGAMKDNPFSKMLLQEVITKWKAELEEDVINYQKQAERVKKWDEQLRENQKVLNNLVDTVHRLYMDQDDLATNIQQISEFQDDLDRDLNELSEQVDKELEKCGDLQPDEALYTREQIYTRATDLDHHLTQLHNNLETIVTAFNEARGDDEDNAKSLEGTNDIAKILKVLNVHNDSLSFIESKSRQLKHDSDALTRQMENMYSNTLSSTGRLGYNNRY